MSRDSLKKSNILDVNPKKCNGCTACSIVCPTHCIAMCENEEGFLYPKVDASKCIQCNKCKSICEKAIPAKPILELYVAKSKNIKVVSNSSSGGMFGELCQCFTQMGGNVSAAKFDSKWDVQHIISNSEFELSQCRGAKYVQSVLNNCYAEIDKLLNDGEKVMFVGTPCQVSGLYKVLKKDYDSLITVSLICHGVNSPAVWRKYISELEDKHNSQIESINMRNKDFGWNKYSMKIQFKNGDTHQKIKREDVFLRGFLSNLYLRQSCYQCMNKGDNNVADIILGDCWGIENEKLEMDTSKGVSLIIVKSQKAKKIIQNISDRLILKEIDSSILGYNLSYYKSALYNQKRNKFFSKFISQKNMSVINEITKMTSVSILRKVLNKIVILKKDRL